MNTFLITIEILIIGYISLSIMYQFILAIASKCSNKSQIHTSGQKLKMLVLVPAYKEDEVIVHATKENLKVHYPRDRYDYVVIADQLKTITIQKLKHLGANVLEYNCNESTKVKALQYANKSIDMTSYLGVVILDADNVMSDNFLQIINAAYCKGARAIQGKRIASNLNSTTAVFDAIAELANQDIVCKGANCLGFSSKLSGSGMFFEKKLYSETIMQLGAIGGFDKELELILTQKSVFIEYIEDAIVYDEKTLSYDDFVQQRSRWLQAQYSFFRAYFKSGLKALLNLNFDHAHKVAQLALPPKALMVAMLVPVLLLGIVIKQHDIVLLSLLMAFINIGTYLLLIPTKWIIKYGPSLLKEIPKLIKATLKALYLMPKASKRFIHTTHHKSA